MNTLKKYFGLLLTFISSVSMAQSSDVEMADIMRSNGKIYVVLAVVLIVFVGFILYLIRLDKKVSRLEKEIKE